MIRFGRTLRALVLGTIAYAGIAGAAGAASLPGCSTTVTTLAGVQTAVGSAAPGAVICLADGTYAQLTLTASKAAPGVTIRAEHPGKATLAGATLDGSYLTVAQFRMVGTFEARPGSTGMTADHNFFDLGAYTGYGVMACASTTTTCNDVSITGNRFIGRAEEDAIRANRYHDGPDADSAGLLIEGNEFAGNQETGGHNDVFQSVWVGDHLVFRRNYLHDFGGQGFFVKDQASAIDGLVAEDNLIVNQDLPCDPASLCPTWQLSPFQLFGPISNGVIRHNTVWPGSSGGFAVLRNTGWSSTSVDDNVFGSFGRDATVGVSGSDNTRCGDNGGWAAVPGMTTDCAPAFLDAARGDYREASGRGVTWRLADQQYGPTDAATAADTTPPDTTITAGPSGTTADATPTFAFTSSEPGSTFACRVDSGSWSGCTSPWMTATLAGGGHSVSVRATDAAGNTDASPATRSFTVAAATNHQPVAAYAYAPSAPVVGQAVSFDAATSTCDDGPCTYTWVDDGPDGPGGTDWPLGTGRALSFTFQEAGTKRVRVTVTDADGDTATTVKAIAVSAGPSGDRPPSVTLTSPAANSALGDRVRFTATASDDHGIARVEFWVDNALIATDSTAPYTVRRRVSGLSAGTHTVTARAFDTAGQAGSSAVTVTKSGGQARARAASAGARRSVTLRSTPAVGATRLAGAAAARKAVRVTLARCEDAKGRAVAVIRVRANGKGRLSAERAQAGLCVLRLALSDRRPTG
jgi:Bacterial Ig domain/PKD domain